MIGRARVVVVALLALSTIAFAVGVAVERSVAGETEADHVVESATNNEGAEETAAEEREEGERHADEEVAGEVGETESEGTAAEADEAILGVNPESPLLVAAAVTVALLLAAAVWWRGTLAVLAATAAFGLLFAVFDFREALHQIDESRSGLAAVAVVAALLHLGVAVVAGFTLSQREPPMPISSQA